jgi:hypothetical protein
VAELAETVGKDVARILPGSGAIGQRAEDDHRVTVIGDDEVKLVEREVWSYQRTVNLSTACPVYTGSATRLFRNEFGRMFRLLVNTAPASQPLGPTAGRGPEGFRL